MAPSRQSPDRLRRDLWRRAQPVSSALAERGFREYLTGLPSVGGAFGLRDRYIRCIDGRLSGGVRLAGSGMLLGMEGAAEFARRAEATGVTYHRDCGAAALWTEKSGLGPLGAPDHAREFAEQLAEAMGGTCTEDILDGTPGFHDELVVYYDGTGAFDPAACRWLPKGFVISRAYLEPGYALSEVDLAIGLALGPTGFGDLFTEKTPLRVVALGSDEGRAHELVAELMARVSPLRPRVVAEDLEAPV